MLRVESFNVIFVAARREWKIKEGDASRDVPSKSRFGVIMSLILMSFCSCSHCPNCLNLALNKIRSACAGQ